MDYHFPVASGGVSNSRPWDEERSFTDYWRNIASQNITTGAVETGFTAAVVFERTSENSSALFDIRPTMRDPRS
jgi:hypothetical protein